MIRKYGSIAAPAEVVRQVFLDFESWPAWMPRVHGVRVLERHGERVLAEVRHARRRGARAVRFEFREHEAGYFERQVGGQARKWEADWRFSPAPEGEGTVVNCSLDLDLGLAGAFAPPGMVQRFIDKTFEETLAGALHQARLAMAKRPVTAPAAQPTPRSIPRIRVVATPLELEIWIGERKYVCPRH